MTSVRLSNLLDHPSPTHERRTRCSCFIWRGSRLGTFHTTLGSAFTFFVALHPTGCPMGRKPTVVFWSSGARSTFQSTEYTTTPAFPFSTCGLLDTCHHNLVSQHPFVTDAALSVALSGCPCELWCRILRLPAALDSRLEPLPTSCYPFRLTEFSPARWMVGENHTWIDLSHFVISDSPIPFETGSSFIRLWSFYSPTYSEPNLCVILIPIPDFPARCFHLNGFCRA